MDLGTRSRRRSSEPGPAGGVDYLSALPDDLLLLVLACLGCAAAAARTGVLARRWRGLWSCLRDLAFRDVALPSLEAALGRVALPPPAVSLLEIRVPDENRLPAGAGVVASLLQAAARLGPEKLVFTFPLGLYRYPREVDLPCFHRATSIALERIPFVLRAPAAGGEFPALQTLSLKGGQVVDLGALLSLCPYLRVLRLKGISPRDYSTTTVHSASLQELVMEDMCTFRTHRVDIVAPILTQLKLHLLTNAQVSISILAPMIENVSWQWSYGTVRIGSGHWTLKKLSLQTAETQGQLTSLHIHARYRRYIFPGQEANFAQEIEKHMIVNFSILDLDLHLTTKGHVFGAFVSHLLGLNRIRSAIRRLKVLRVRQGSWEKDVCGAVCPCQPTNWRTQIISLTALEEVEIHGSEGEDHELDFLKLVCSCAPMLKKVIVKLSDEISSTDDTNMKICDIFRGYPSVKCNVYLSSED
ncbi:hypothetical protein ZWY2020_000993 [Hordeum vulgare]|nr:hypothetical protein ZWY2020_000993 [Hordeum vulgare]